MLSSEIPPGVSERDIMDGCHWDAGGMTRWRTGGKIRVISNRRARQGLVIRSPRPESVGEDTEALFAEMTSLKTSGCVL